jgi:hypothetical protein
VTPSPGQRKPELRRRIHNFDSAARHLVNVWCGRIIRVGDVRDPVECTEHGVGDLRGTPLGREDERPRPRGDDGEQLGAMVVPAIIASEEKPVAVPDFREPDLVLRATGKALRERNDVQPGVTKSESDFRRIDRFIEKTRIARDTPLRQRVERIRSG